MSYTKTDKERKDEVIRLRVNHSQKKGFKAKGKKKGFKKLSQYILSLLENDS